MYRHHSFEERLDIVSRLKSGEPLRVLSRETGIDCKQIRMWRLRYEKYGEDGLRDIKYRRHTAEEKLAIVKEIVEKGVPLSEICLRYDVDRMTVKCWRRKYLSGESLENGRRGRPPKGPMGRPKKREPQTEQEKLQAEVIRLRAENALLKKVKALVEEKEARARMNGQKPSTN